MKNSVYIINSPPFWLKTPPLALVYLENYLKQNNIKTQINDLNLGLYRLMNSNHASWLTLNQAFEEDLFTRAIKGYPQFFKNLLDQIKDYDFVALSIFKRNWSFTKSLKKLIENKYSQKKFIFGGPQSLMLSFKKQLSDDNYWVIGEGEIPLHQILTNNPQKIYSFQEVEDLDTLPFYDLTSIRTQDYSNSLPLLSSRGCPFRCNFCSERLLSKKFRYHSPQYMIEQIQLLKNTYHTNHFVFLDSMINYNENWLNEFCLLVINNKLNIKWEAQIRVKGDFPLGLAKLLKQSGCFNLFVGLESASDKVLKLMNKGFDQAQALSFFKTLHKARLNFEISLILGYPGEEDKEFKETKNFIIKNKSIISKIAQINPFIDYLNDFPNLTTPSIEAKKWSTILLKTLEKEKIKHTKSFINNLIYD